MTKMMFCLTISDYINIVLIIINMIMAYAAIKTSKSTKETVDEMKLTRQEENYANIIVYFKIVSTTSTFIYLVIENLGNTTAENIKITTDPELKNSWDGNFNSIKNVCSLAPKQSIEAFFDTTYQYREKFGELPKYTFSISFKDIYGNKKKVYKEDLSYLDHLFGSESDNIDYAKYRQLKDIAKNLKDINQNLKKK